MVTNNSINLQQRGVPYYNDTTGTFTAPTLTNFGVIVGAANNAISSLTVGSNGQLLIGSTGANPVFGTLTSSDSSITFTTGAGTLSIQGTQATTSQKGSVTLATSAQAIAGTDTNNAVTSAALAAKLGAQTNHGVLLGSGTSTALGITAVGSNGQLLIGSTGADPSFSTLTSSDSSISFTTGAGTLSIQGTQATTSQKGSVTLATNSQAIAGTDANNAVTSAALAAKLGAQTNHGVLLGSGTSTALGVTAVGSNGQLLIGSTGADPSFSTLTSSDSSISFTTGAGTLSIQGTQATTSQKGSVTLATNSQAIAGTDANNAVTSAALAAKLGAQTANSILLGQGSSSALSSLTLANNQLVIGTGAAPTAATLTAGAGIGINVSGGAITISSTAGGVGTWTSTAANTTMNVNTGYLTTKASPTAVTLTLPTTAAQFSQIAIAGAGSGTGGWQINQGAGQVIIYGSVATTTGAGGSLSSTNPADAVYLLCTAADTTWTVVNSIGNIAYV